MSLDNTNNISNTVIYSDFCEIGYVTAVTDGIAYVHGLNNVFAGEVVRFNGSILGLAVNIEENITGVTIFGNDRDIVQGDYVERLYTMLEVPAGITLLGRTVDALGNIIDNCQPLLINDDIEGDDTTESLEGDLDLNFINVGNDETEEEEELINSGDSELELRSVEVKAPGIISRMSVNEPLLTGIIAIDSMIPIGRGQRELIIGDRQTGKTAIAIDTIINQHSNTFYV